MKIKFSLPVQLVLVIAAAFLISPYMNETVVRAAYTFSLFFKAVLSCVLPLVIFTFVLSGILSFKKGAPLALAVLVGLIFFSNGFVALLSYFLASVGLPFATCSVSECGSLISQNPLIPFASFNVPYWISASSVYGLFNAVILGVLFSIWRAPAIEKGLSVFKSLVERAIYNIFIPLLPIYVFGFMLKIRYEGTFELLFRQYGTTCLLIIGMQIVYLVWFYWLAQGFSWSKAKKSIAVALPSYLTAFSTMSSTATIPVSVDSATKNTGNEPLAQMAMPIMANVHLLGDSVGTPMLALATMYLFTGTLPSFLSYLFFIPYFCIAMFGVAGLPGGGILVMLPLLSSQFGFTEEMIAVVMSLYVLLDPFGTAANVMGDGALVIMVNKILKRLKLS